jgi:hypothetical protein
MEKNLATTDCPDIQNIFLQVSSIMPFLEAYSSVLS